MMSTFSVGQIFKLKSISILIASLIATQSYAACTKTNNSTNGLISSIKATQGSQCTIVDEILESETNNGNIVSSTGANSMLNFTADNVKIISNDSGQSKAINTGSGAEVNFAGNLDISLDGTNPLQNFGIVLQSESTINVEKNLSISGNVDNHFISANAGTLNVKGNTELIISDSTLRGGAIMTAPSSNATLNFAGKTDIINH